MTTTGERKLVEVYDCSGAGDVDISTIVKSKDGEIVGLTGRKLKVISLEFCFCLFSIGESAFTIHLCFPQIPGNWKNPSGNYHIGVKNAYELYTSWVRERVDKEKKEKVWDPAHKVAVAEVTRKMRVYHIFYLIFFNKFLFSNYYINLLLAFF